MSEGIKGPEPDCAGALGTSDTVVRTFGLGVEPLGLRTPGDLFVVCGVEGKPPTPRRAGVLFIVVRPAELFRESFRS